MTVPDNRIAYGNEPVEIRVRGTVQGVGFRPTVWRIAREDGLAGEVLNDSAGVLIRIAASADCVGRFVSRLRAEAPPLAQIESIEIAHCDTHRQFRDFCIAPSVAGENLTRIAPDAATCPACLEEITDPNERRYRYPFTNCTHCGPRLSIVRTVPYDRANTTMSVFPLCKRCAAEYADPADRRFHAQPVACPDCGPRVWLEGADELLIGSAAAADPVEHAAGLIRDGRIVGVRGLGGFHLACDAGNENAVAELRRRKRRYGKPFALMARDVETIRRFCTVTADEANLLTGSRAPIVLLDARPAAGLARDIAPGLRVLGFMLPYTPLHHLLLGHLHNPIVMTSANLSSEPQVIDNEVARQRLFQIADVLLMHDRDIENRIDDSVVRVAAGRPRLMRRARGFAPAALPLPPGFDGVPDLLAFGGELKSTFCVIKNGSAVLSQHQGDLEEPTTFEDYRKNLALYRDLYDHQPQIFAADLHPEYASTKLAAQRSQSCATPLVGVQHHHAHVASCMAENGIAREAGPVLGIVLDGLGYGDDGTFWGGEFLLARYSGYRRLASFRPVPMIGGIQAIRQPWRNTYAHLQQAFDWTKLQGTLPGLELWDFMNAQPLATLNAMLAKDINVPLASSCGRLFDGVAAALGLSREEALFEGQGAMQLEALAEAEQSPGSPDDGYPFAIGDNGGAMVQLDAAPMWRALLDDLAANATASRIASRFHRGLAAAIADLAALLYRRCGGFEYVALSGGCFQNRLLLELTVTDMESRGLRVLTQTRLPCNDGGLALGQAAVAASRYIENQV